MIGLDLRRRSLSHCRMGCALLALATATGSWACNVAAPAATGPGLPGKSDGAPAKPTDAPSVPGRDGAPPSGPPGNGADAGGLENPPDARPATARPDGGADPGTSTDGGTPPPQIDELAHLAKVVPVLWITVAGKTIPRDLKIAGRMKVIEDHDGTLDGIMARPATLDAPIGIELRGQSSFEYDQKPYGIEIRDQAGEGVPTALLGLPPEADFVLHSCYADKTCMRNALTYQVGREMGLPSGRWAPRTRYVEIYVDGRYQGLYLLVERIKRDKARINLPAPAPDATTPGDLTGGYIFSQEGDGGRAGADWPSPFDPRGKLVYRYPRADLITAAQKSYLQEAVKGLAQALTAEPRLSEATRKRLDVDSFLDYVLVQELVNNVDAYWKSWFLYKAPEAAGGRFFMGPLWDFDLGYGNIIFKKRYCANTSASSELGGPFAALLKDAEVKDSLRCRWNTLRAAGGPLDLARLEDKIAAFSRHMKTAKARDQERWRNIGAWIWPNNYIGASWADEVTYLRYWLRKRLAWLDQSLAGTCPAVPAPAAVELIAAPTKVMENNTRMPYLGRDAPAYIPIEGVVPANLTSWACPK